MSDYRAELNALLADKASDELGREDAARLTELQAQWPDVDPDEFERVAGEITATLVGASSDAMPEHLKEQIARTGQEFVSSSTTPKLVVDPPQSPSALPGSDRSSSGWIAWSGWAVAAMVSALWLGGVGQSRVPQPPTLAELRAQLFTGSGDAVEVAWSATEDPAATGASGDVVWSNASQSGIMRFVGLEANEATEFRYQLWIFDANRDARYPVDGGLFDVLPGAAEVLVPVDARLLVGEPTLFAVTVERSDGVVVSDRSRIVVVAPMGDVSQAGQ